MALKNAIGRMRRGLPRKTDLAVFSEDRLLALVRAYNHTPRKCLNYKTPAEVFCHELLHLKCESTIAPERQFEDLALIRCQRKRLALLVGFDDAVDKLNRAWA